MKTFNALILSLALQSSLLHSTPWEDYVNDLSGKANAGDADAMGILADVMSDLKSNNQEEILRLAKESATKSSPFGKYVSAILINKNDLIKAKSTIEEVLPQLEEKAGNADLYAAFVLACIYTHGQCGVTKDSEKGMKWMRKASEQGLAPAQSGLGFRYFNGWGVTKNEAEALKWFSKAADQEYAPAQSVLGFMYFNGRGVTKNEAEALKWFSEAADQGYEPAQFSLGFMYHTGKGVTKDEVEALKWYRKAADQGNAEAQERLGFMYRTGKGVTKDEVEALKWYRKAADQGNAEAQRIIETLFSTGEGISSKDERSKLPLANNLNREASALCQKGNFAKARELQERALEIYEKAIGPQSLETAASLNNLASTYRSMGDDAKARELFERILTIFEKIIGTEVHSILSTSQNKVISSRIIDCLRNFRAEIRTRQEFIQSKRDKKTELVSQLDSATLSSEEKNKVHKQVAELEAEESSLRREFDYDMKVRRAQFKEFASRVEKEEANKAVNANPTTRENARTAKLVDNVESLKAEFGEGPSGGIQCVNYKTDRDRTSGSGLPDYFCVWPERDYLQAQITISEATHSLETQSLYVYIMIVWPNQENLIFRKYAGIDLNRAKTSNFRAEDFPLLKEVCAKFSIWEQKLKNEGIVDPFKKEMSGDYCFVWKDSKAMLAKGPNLELVAKSDQIPDIQFVINNFQSMLASIDNFNVKNKLQKKSIEKNINKLLD